MGFCICIIRNNIYRFRISWNNKLENRLQTETADHKIRNVKLIFCFTLLMLGLGLASARIKYLAFDFIEIVFILLMIEYISVLDISHRHTIINYDDTQHGRSKAWISGDKCQGLCLNYLNIKQILLFHLASALPVLFNLHILNFIEDKSILYLRVRWI